MSPYDTLKASGRDAAWLLNCGYHPQDNVYFVVVKSLTPDRVYDLAHLAVAGWRPFVKPQSGYRLRLYLTEPNGATA